jgi:hypothetical protein
MKTKLSIVLFVAIATVALVVMAFVLFTALVSLYVFAIAPRLVSSIDYGGLAMPFLIVTAIVALGLAFLAYAIVIKRLGVLKNIDPE